MSNPNTNTPALEALPPPVTAVPMPPPAGTPVSGSSPPFGLPPKTPPSRQSTSRPYTRQAYRPSSRIGHHITPSSSSDIGGPKSSASMRSMRSMRSIHSTTPLHPQERDEWEDDYYYRPNEPDWGRDHYQESTPPTDIYTRRTSRTSRHPPRAYVNRQWDAEGPEVSPTPFKHYLEESQSRRRLRQRDEEMGFERNGSDSGFTKFDWKTLSKEEKAEVLRLPWTQWMNSEFKNHFVASCGEFIGTTLFLLFAYAGTEVANIQSQAASDSADSNSTTGAATGFDLAVLLYISLIFGFSLMVNVWIFFRISGGLFNPAVTLGMLLVQAISPIRAVCLFVTQLLGSMLASVIVRFLLPENFNVRTTLTGGATLAQGVFIEAILTAELVFTIFMLAKEKHRATFIAPVGIGLALFIAEMVGVQFTGGSLNPARSFGPCVVTLTFDEEHWIYWVGPILGSLIAVGFYRFIKMLEYETANPGADGDPLNDPIQNPEKMAELKSRKSQFSLQV